MIVINQLFSIMAGINNIAYKINGKINKAVCFFMNPYIVNINLQTDIKVFREIIIFESSTTTNSKISCVYLPENNQLKKRQHFLEKTAFSKENNLKREYKKSRLIKTKLLTFILIYFII